MKILLAPDSFKGSLSSKDVCTALKEGILRAAPDAEIIEVPVADGGEGTVDAIVTSTESQKYTEYVTGPLGDKVKAHYGILKGGTAIIEMASASGLYLIPEDRRNPLITTSFGTGELIESALDRGCRKFIIGIGGSATNDGGAGMLQALGVKFMDNQNRELDYGGGNLDKLAGIDLDKLDKRIYDSQFIVASDVNNPLCGENGASAVYGPQKNATPEMVKLLDRNLQHYALVVKHIFNKDLSEVPGAGAAGGLGFALIAFLNAELKNGIDIVMDITSMENKIENSDLVITGEGNTDFQTSFGKAPSGVAKLAKKYNKPVIILSGGLGKNYKDLYHIGVTSLFSIADRPMTLENAMENTFGLIEDRMEDIMRIILAFGR
ncbi:glycerate kinase family protein [Clostridium luticellarii]|uniref:Glycerate 2-kinase n=1 Tax=Clostridium luticellarii TaxID=1691940 RepID=A0A2T0BNE9_9CLOT|nr:glycerate kinase [Clostridium luticellarii]MCI1945376.1 glycerate kinase [Clostridium luticellarii]MCI1968711.1 glycerate kinase [Clostridium luticellarii]MCI1994934.1 glycerate kinase [Clostridium luticellarii]MCI2040136.1 glycerate kinase [Clostridium luticellarii]PRR85383.1 Glycerate 2-kinase [Clostridium luticellarii]